MEDVNKNNLSQRIKKTSHHLLIWTAAWVISLALLAFGPRFLWDFSTGFSLAAIAVNVFFGFKMVVANKRHLDSMDELQRKIHMNAIAISLGTTMVFSAVYGLLNDIKLIGFEANASNILFVMALSYVASVFIGFRKYQ